MKFSTFFTVAAVASIQQLAQALPSRGNTEELFAPTVTEILNFALTLEHAENAFYTEVLRNYTQEDFLNAGFQDWARGRWEEIAQHEATHVEFLTGILGEKAVKPCTYDFPINSVTDVPPFGFLLETVGVSAYNGALPALANAPEESTYAGSILAVEARQSAWINSALLHANPWNTAFDTPLTMNQVFTIASGVIKSCPPTNLKLPVTAFPALTFPADAQPGQTVEVSFSVDITSEEKIAIAFIFGLESITVQLEKGTKTVTIPDSLQGVVFAIVVNDNNSTTDAVTIAGPSFLSFDFNSKGET